MAPDFIKCLKTTSLPHDLRNVLYFSNTVSRHQVKTMTVWGVLISIYIPVTDACCGDRGSHGGKGDIENRI